MSDIFQKANTKGANQTVRSAGWSAPVLFANPRRQVFSRRCPYDQAHEISVHVHVSKTLLSNAGSGEFAKRHRLVSQSLHCSNVHNKAVDEDSISTEIFCAVSYLFRTYRLDSVSVCVCVCVRACVRACVCARHS